MFPGPEWDLISTSPGPAGQPKDKRKDPKVWLAGELIVRCECQGLTNATLPRQLFEKATLQQLILTGNYLTSLPEDMQLLTQLKELRLARNKLCHLPSSLCKLQLLEVLEVQHNQLKDIPGDLCRLVHLHLLNLDENPLALPLQDVWAAAGTACMAGTASSMSQLLKSSGRQVAAARQELLRAKTECVLQYLLERQDADVVLQVKQARLMVLQEASTKQIRKSLHVADLESLAACMQVAKTASLDQSIQQEILTVQAVVLTLQAALDNAQQQHFQQKQQQQPLQHNLHQQGEQHPPNSIANSSNRYDAVDRLRTAIKDFEQLCKPGRPSGSMYTAAHAVWRQLQRQQLERGWRCSSPQPLAAAGASNVALSQTTCHIHQDSGSRRCFMTLQEQKRLQLQGAGVPNYEEWSARKNKEHRLQLQQNLEQHQHEALEKQQCVADRAAQALAHCDREMGWPSHLGLEPFPSGTFRIPPQQLKAIRRAYQKQ